MARSNMTARGPVTHEGGAAVANATPLLELRRACLAALLWEDAFYEKGKAHAKRVAELVTQCHPREVAALAVEAREQQHLRHLPLFLVACLSNHPEIGAYKGLPGQTLLRVIQRPDEIAEFVAIFWSLAGRKAEQKRAPGKFVIPRGCRRALGRAFAKFDRYALAKYRGDDKAVKLVDVLRMARPKPKDAEQAALWKELRAGTLKSFDTWESQLSAGADKKATFEGLLREQKLGGLAFLRNLRNMEQAGVDRGLVLGRLQAPFPRVLPFRFIAAAKYAPGLALELGQAMDRQLATEGVTLKGQTVILVDVSGSMDATVSAKSEVTRWQAAAALAALARARCESARVFSFSDRLVEVPNYTGIALVDAINASQAHSSTYLGNALQVAERMTGRVDRLIVFTDEQSHDAVGAPFATFGYLVNVATNEHGVGFGPWVRINGWSERTLDFVAANEGVQAPDREDDEA